MSVPESAGGHGRRAHDEHDAGDVPQQPRARVRPVAGNAALC